MAFDAEFYDGFDKYGPTDFVPTISDLNGEWTTLTVNGGVAVVPALVGTGYGLRFTSASPSGVGVSKTLPGNYARMIGGVTFASNLLSGSAPFVIAFGDGATDQLSIAVNTSGQITARRGTMIGSSGTLLGTSAESVAAGAPHCLEWDVTVHNTGGIVKVWLDGVLTTLNLSSQDTTTTANDYFNTFRLFATGGGSNVTTTVDHLYCWMFTASGGSDTPALTNPIIETQFPSGDDSADFAFGAGVLGQAYRIATTTSAPGANRLTLRKWTPAVAATLNSIGLRPAATSATAKFKGVVYADSGGAPGSLLSSGTEVVGCTSGALLTLPLTTPQSLSAGVQYWVGYITDTSIAVQQYDTGVLGYGAANTYASGAPGTAPTMTAGLASWMIWGNLTGVAVNWAEVGLNPAIDDLSYVTSATPGDEDLFTFPALVSTPTVIYSVATKAKIMRTDAGARTIDLEAKSAAVTSSGSAPGQTPATAYGWLGSYFDLDPNTSAAWNASGVNNAKAGYKIAT